MTRPVALAGYTPAAFPLGVIVPRYDRAAVRPRIVHIGMGGFHRPHQVVYTDDLLQGGVGYWGICRVRLV